MKCIKWMSVCLISLLISTIFCELHSLEFLSTILSGPGDRPHFEQTTVFDGVIISHCDSVTKIEKLRQNWVNQSPQWRESTLDCSQSNTDHEVALWQIRQMINNSTVDVLQRRRGCTYITNESSSGFDRWGLNGENFLTFDPTSLKWMSESLQANPIEQSWNSNKVRSHMFKEFVQHDCCSLLTNIMKTREGAGALEQKTEVHIFAKPNPQKGDVSLRCHVTSTNLSGLKVHLTRDRVVMTDRVRVIGPLPNVDGSVLLRLNVEIPTDHMKTWHYHCEVQTSTSNTTALWDGFTVNGKYIHSSTNTLCQNLPKYSKLMILLVIWGILVTFIIVIKCYDQKKPKPAVDPKIKEWFLQAIKDTMHPVLRIVLGSMAFGTDFPEAYRNTHEEWMEMQALDDEYYVPSGKYAS